MILSNTNTCVWWPWQGIFPRWSDRIRDNIFVRGEVTYFLCCVHWVNNFHMSWSSLSLSVPFFTFIKDVVAPSFWELSFSTWSYCKTDCWPLQNPTICIRVFACWWFLCGCMLYYMVPCYIYFWILSCYLLISLCFLILHFRVEDACAKRYVDEGQLDWFFQGYKK
jgi:hypothetical protein